MTDSPDLTILEVPARIANLGFRIAVPTDWNAIDLPAEEVDFSSPVQFFPLLLVAAPWAAVILTAAARPGFGDGSLQDWSLFLLDAQGFRPTAFGPAAIGSLQGLAGVARQQQDGTWMELRFAFFEDGGRLVYLGLLAPEAISAPLENIWQSALRSFALEEAQGQNVPIGPGLGAGPEESAQPEASSAPPAAEPDVLATPESPAVAESAEAPPDSPSEEEFAYYAKAADTSTLDPENPINARLRNQGVGFVPNLLDLDEGAKSARLGAGAIGATIQVALGWHVIDDGRRTMVLDPDGKIQINLSVIAREGRSIDEILDDIQAEAEQSYPEPEFLRLEDDGIWAIAIRNIAVNGEAVEQVHMLTRWANDSAVLRARVTADPASMRFAANYADLILKSAEYGAAENTAEEEDAPPEESDFSSQEPAWMQRARALERADRLEEAEQLIRDSVPNLHFAITIADLYRDRWLRLQGSHPDQARQARQKAADWAYSYASAATSGGEGVALSYERDKFLRTLGPEPLD